MSILDRYLGKALCTGAALVMAVLLALFFTVDVIDQLDDMGTGSYGFWQIIEYVLLIQPRRIYELLPLAALLGGLLGLGWLAGNSELIAIRAAGVALPRIVLAVMKTGLAMMALVFLMGEFIAPASDNYAERQRSFALNERISLTTAHGFWTRDGQSFINIRDILPGDRLGDISIYEFDAQRRLRTTTHAARANYEQGRWMLEDIVQTQLDTTRVTTSRQARAAWESLLDPDIVNLVSIRPARLSAWDLHRYIDYLRDNGQTAQRYQQAFWSKITAPFVTGVMVLLVIAFVFGAARSTDMGQRMLVGSLVGVVFHLLNQTTTQASLVYNLNPALSAAFVPTLFLMLALGLLRRI